MSRKWTLRVSVATLVASALVGTATIAGAEANTDHIYPGERLVTDAKQTSRNGQYELVQQADGNLVEYRMANGKRAAMKWQTRTQGHPGAATFLQNDGNLVVYKNNDPKPVNKLWESNTDGASVGHLTVQNDGNIVLYDRVGVALWASQGLMLPGGAGPQNFDQGKAATAALRELGQWHDPSRLGSPGQCMVSVRRWIEAAGGRTAGGGVMDTYLGSPAKKIATGNTDVVRSAVGGDVIQYVYDDARNDFVDGVHTVMVVKRNADGSLWIVQSNGGYDESGNPDGMVSEVKSWRPHPKSGFTAYLWRFGR